MTKEILWTSKEILKAIGGESSSEFEASGISIDSRSLKKGEIYIAIKGDNLDGHDYVSAAFEAGASAAIVEKTFKLDTDKTLIYVENSFEALQNIGIESRKRTSAKIIAVTGSAGKTGTKELLSIAFKPFGKTYASKKSFNNHWGVPLSLANMPLDCEFGIFELGMNHKGELEELAKQVMPNIAIITTIEPVHIEFFKNIEEIAEAKAEIFKSMESKAVAILNLDNPMYLKLKKAALSEGINNIISFGEDEAADIILNDYSLSSDSIKIVALIDKKKIKYKLNIAGKHIAVNSLSVLAAVKSLGYNISKAVEALKTSEPVEGRGNRILVNIVEGEPPITIIDESYNANPASMLAAFNVFQMAEPQNEGRRIAVLGDMLELGRDGPKLHTGLVNPLLKAKADLVFCCGPQMEALFSILPQDWQGGYKNNSQDLAQDLIANIKPGDVVLVKGSAGSKMSYVVQALESLKMRGAA